jgi:hypothetical protein
MKKKLIPFILGLSMVAALPLAAHADVTTPEEDSGNVKYGSFATVNTEESGDTPVLTAIPECTMTIPRDTTIKRGSLSANIGRVTIDGKFFVKPYYIEVTATRKNFTKVYSTAAEITASGESGASVGNVMGDNYVLAKHDIVFDVATTQQATSGVNPTSGTAASNSSFVQSGTISMDAGSKKTTYQDGSVAARRFWKDETKTGTAQEAGYLAGEISPINGQNDIFVNIGTTQWTGASGSEADTKPVGGKYSGNITFTATFKDDFDSTTMNGNNVWFATT